MKRIICFWALLFVVSMVSAQTQYGYVKSQGRTVNGKYKPGEGLPGATVTIKNLTPIVVRSQDGEFSFPVPKGLKYCVNSVEMKDYQLLNVNDLKPRTYSGDTIELVMFKPDQQKADVLAFTREFRSKSEPRFKRLEDSIQSLNISLEEKNRQLEEIEKERDLNEKYIKELAEYYATIDYDRISDFQREVDALLKEGEFKKARQLLYKKGTPENRLEEIRSKEKIVEQKESEIKIGKAGTMMEKQELAQNCYSLFHLYLLEQRYDSASYYIEFRANIDTTNAKWQNDAASFFSEQFVFDKAELYYMKALNNYSKSFEDNKIKVGAIKNNLSLVYQNLEKLDRCEMLLNEAIDIFSGIDSTYSEDGIDLDKEVGLLMTYTSLISVYYREAKLSQADSLVHHVLVLLENNQDEVVVPTVLSMIGMMQSCAYKTNEFEKLTNAAIETARQMALNDTSKYGLLETTLFCSAMSSFNQDDFERAESLLLETLDYMKLNEKYNGEDEESNIANIQQTLGLLYFKKNYDQESEKWYSESLEYYRRINAANPFKYNGVLYGILVGLAQIKEKNNLYDESESLFQEALNLDLRRAFTDSLEYDVRVSFVQNEIGRLKVIQDQQTEAASFFTDALEKRRRMAAEDFGAYSSVLANTLFYLGSVYCNDKIGRCEEGVSALSEAAAIIRQLLAEGQPVQDNRGCQEEQELKQKQELFFAAVLLQLGVNYSNLHRYDASLAALTEADSLFLHLSENEPQYKSTYAQALGVESSAMHYLGRFVEAEQRATEALEIDIDQPWLFSYLAAAKLFQGKFDEAEEIYRHMKPDLKDVFLYHLDDFEAAGIVPAERKSDVERIKKMLSE